MKLQAPVPTNPEGVAYQMTPMGIVAGLGSDVPTVMPGLIADEPERVGQPTVPQPPLAPKPQVPARRPAAGLTPRDVLRIARTRIKELRAFMREAKKAEKELRELERLVAAAKGKSFAPVRDLRRTAG